MIFESRLVNSNGEHIGWMGSIIDISERRRLEERDRSHTETLAQHARLNDMGLLASELAHELNQPLTTILSYSAGLSMSLKAMTGVDPDDLVAMEEVNRHARKAGDIVNWIRRQTSRTDPVRKAFDINMLLSEVAALRRRQLQKVHAELTMDLTHHVANVTADRVGIEQVVSNLIRNAADALASKEGRRTISVTSKHLSTMSGGAQTVQVSVSDNGPGLQGRTVEMLCSTFYSTKNDGMGLGLGICRSIIESHGGTLVAEESPGGGASFSFTLPAASASA